MTESTGIFDDPYDVRAQRRRRLRRALRIAVPLGTLLVMLVAMLGIGAFMFQQNRHDARALSDDLLTALDHRIATEVRSYLAPAATEVRVIAGVLGDEPFRDEGREIGDALAARTLETHRQFANVLFADSRGDFIMHRKQADGRIDTKLVDRRGGEPVVTWVRRDAAGKVLYSEVDPADRYDPRGRPWYEGAVRTEGIYWSDVYIFYTDREPGVTVSLALRDENGGAARAVFAIDMRLDALGTFLRDLEVGRDGRAMIIDAAGALVAYPDAERMMKEVDGEPVPARIEDLGDPVLNRVYDSFRLEGHGRREVTIDGRRYITAASPLAVGTTRDWTVLMVVPERDFVGFVTRTNRTGMILAAAVLVLASLLATLLAVQGLRADRNARLVLDRQRQLEAQSRAFSDLASQASLFVRGDSTSLAALTRTVAETLRVRRVSVWRLTEDGSVLECADCYDRDSGGHTPGVELEREGLEKLFAAIEAGEEVVAPDATGDERCAALHGRYLQPMGCRTLVSLPIVRGDRTAGVLWIEDDTTRLDADSEEVAFCRAIANILALRYNAQDLPQPAPASAPGGTVPGAPRARAQRPPRAPAALAAPMSSADVLGDRRATALLAYLERQRSKGRRLQVEVLEEACVMVLRLDDDIALAEVADEGTSVLDHIVRSVTMLAGRHGVEYCKLLGSHIVCAVADEDPARGAGAIAGFALEVQDDLRALFSQLERPVGFTIGVDSGPAMGGMVGNGAAVFNLWGQSPDAAASMAESGIPGCIQVTESAYRHLHDEFVFRMRGAYYVEHVGELTTYVLAGHS